LIDCCFIIFSVFAVFLIVFTKPNLVLNNYLPSWLIDCCFIIFSVFAVFLTVFTKPNLVLNKYPLSWLIDFSHFFLILSGFISFISRSLDHHFLPNQI
jgi:hypothetical protein